MREKGGKVRDIPVPAPVLRVLAAYVAHGLLGLVDTVTPDTPLFWLRWCKRSGGTALRPMTGKNVWRLCKVYGGRIGYPELKPHDLRHGVAVEVLSQRYDIEEVRALLGHSRIDTTQIYTTIRPPQLKQAVAFYDAQAEQLLGE